MPAHRAGRPVQSRSASTVALPRLARGTRRIFLRFEGRPPIGKACGPPVGWPSTQEDAIAKILVADDDAVSAFLITRALESAGHECTVAKTGLAALACLKRSPYDALVTDWMMPELDGPELVRRVHQSVDPVPVIVMATCLSMPEAHAHALEAGVDEFLTKPVHAKELVAAFDHAFARRHQTEVPSEQFLETFTLPPKPAVEPRFPLVVVGANAGGPSALRLLLRGLPPEAGGAAFVVAQHLQPQMLESLVPILQRETGLRVSLAVHGQQLTPGRIFVTPGGKHACISSDGGRVELNDDVEENHVRPAADPLFRTAAATFRERLVAVVLTGMGRDGTAGAARVSAAGGQVLVAAPGPQVASAMPESVIRAGFATAVVPLVSMGQAVGAALVRTVQIAQPQASVQRVG